MPIESIEEVRVFLQVVDQKSFTAAARSLSLTTNIVSRRVVQLEARLGVRLLHRTTRSVSLTEEGRRFVVEGRRLVEQVEVAEAVLRKAAEETGGSVRIAVPTALVRFGLVSAVRSLLGANTALRVQLIVADHPVDLVANGIDVAVVDVRASASYVLRKVGTFSPALAAAPGYVRQNGEPRRPNDLAAHECLRFISRAPQTSWGLVDQRGRRVIARVGGRFESNDSRALHDAMYAGIGIGLCAEGELRDAVAAKKLVRVLPTYAAEPMVIRAVTPARPGPIRARRVEAVLDVLRETLQRLA